MSFVNTSPIQSWQIRKTLRQPHSFDTYLVQGQEMPTSTDLKSGDSLFFPMTPRGRMSTGPLPQQIDSVPKLWHENGLGHYMNSYMRYIALQLTHFGCALIEHIPVYLTSEAGGSSVEICPLKIARPPGLCTNSAVDLPPNCSSVTSVHSSRASLLLKSHRTSCHLNLSIGSGKIVLTAFFMVGCRIKLLIRVKIPSGDAMFAVCLVLSHLSARSISTRKDW